MYLKRLEVLGFKSFADKIRLEFLPGVTAVVGPNGSGKSNISDALRWVLGEQSIKTLRGAKMDDVIFAGTQLRKPLGMAEVTVVLDNSDHTAPVDFTEVSITRRLFRSGESEYLINKAQVRLRDILELFFDTGLGKDAYSVIGQGRIDVILSAKAEERRSIFEEAAGIIKYKTRKQIAEHKLEETEHSLIRVRDIIGELNLQMGPLEHQAALATRFLDCRQHLTNLEINYFYRKALDLEDVLAKLNRTKTERDAEYQDFEGRINIVESEIETNRLALIEQDNHLNQLNEGYYRIQNTIDKYNEQLNFSKGKLDDLKRQENELEKSLMENRERTEVLRGEKESIDREIEKVRERLNGQQQAFSLAEQQQAAEVDALRRLEAEEQSRKDDLIEAMNELAGLRNKANSTTLQKEFIQKQVTDCQKKRENLKRQCANSEEKYQAAAVALNDVNGQIGAWRQEQTELRQKVTAWEGEIAAREGENHECQQKIRGLEGKISVLAEMEKSHQGYFQGVKALVEEAASQPFHRAIHGIVADLIKVRSGMELAIETALGSALQNIVIEHDRDAQEAIAYLKRQGKGRATFLPMNQVRGVESKLTPYRSTLQQYGAQAALDLLEFDPQYQQIFSHLLHQVIVAPDLKSAVGLGSKMDRGFRLVTPEGDLVNPGGSITGGSIDHRRLGLLSRRREIDDLRAEKELTEKQLASGLQWLTRKQEERTEGLRRIESLKLKDQEANLHRVSLEREAQAFRQEVKRYSDEEQLLETEEKDLFRESEVFETGKEELERMITTKEQELKQLETEISRVTGNLSQAKQTREALSSQLGEMKAELSAGEQELNGKIQLRANFEKQAGEGDISCRHFEQQKEQLHAEQLEIGQVVAQGTERIQEENHNLERERERIKTVKTAREQLMTRIKELEDGQKTLRRRNGEFQNLIHRLELSINDKQNELAHLDQTLGEEYGANWRQQADHEWTEPENTSGMIQRLKTELKELGPVNPASIGEYQQVCERFDFLTVQSEDLTRARESLQKVISEIESTIEKRFLETFELVRIEFKKLFAELFEGGSADLHLAAPEDPLNSGIEIFAQPPGKKLQSLSLLSGGERAMTAIALLFSILRIKPAPFCVLDEIDAALDDANVQRFAHLLEIFSERSQFIVVTHRRGTMEVANALYGVTMEEMGISKLISLDLNREKAG